jgi:hypothetical protein
MDDDMKAKLAAMEVLLAKIIDHLAVDAREKGTPTDAFYRNVNSAGVDIIDSTDFMDVDKSAVKAHYTALVTFFSDFPRRAT